MKRQGRVWIRVFPDVPVSDKPAEVRMGKGKGAVEYWAARVAPGRIMFEVDGVPDDVAREALRLGAAKLPVKTRVVTRLDAGHAGAREHGDIDDVRRMTPDQLQDELAEAEEGAVQPALPGRHRPDREDPPRGRGPRRDIARIKTVLRANSARRLRKREPMPKRILEGVVVSDKGDKTVVVKVERTFLHPVLKKTVRRSKKYHAHDEANAYKTGEHARIVECAPKSKLKTWEVLPKGSPAA